MRRAGTIMLLALVAGCATDSAPAVPPSSPPVATSVVASPAAGPLDLATRGPAADAFARARGGTTGIAVRDRVTGRSWGNRAARTPFRAASTVKLAIAVDLLGRARAGAVRLTAADRAALRAMLVRSDNAATDRLWARFGGAAIGSRFPAYGLVSATRTDAWDQVRCTPEDLLRLVGHVLDRVHPADRATLVDLLRAVEPAQRWGVFGVVGTGRPGGKNGWLPTGAGWAVATAGFVGPGERYAVAVMTTGAPDFVAGVETVTGTVTTLLLGVS
ncbi:MAG TPA: serine hydrolase [Mycobacteriales bacterium]|nr:serine hydrolase [Mycobacteriales bacterium]